ncbi:P-loop containing nucleoside triphosphate hydrolase protein [Kockovaella imperatae]|uniref:ATP-dependent RNA helicase n=1 Tax=Kockovaella imperatae TaxID=4999 RepID=A0A1Y1UT38_9TREE|nr:P-loop containing nucleoside triphosphate hydrolase protein [Kockovaella imperatae]ORX41183.1 P-loop containing nucleoside triphosphate hydrolase protein [Kockovaella imperatae]
MAFLNREASSSKSTVRNGKDVSKQRPRSGSAPRVNSNQARRDRADQELISLQQRIDTFDAKKPIETFSDLPLSSKTLKGLKSSHFVSPTPIQSLSIPDSLRGKDVLGSAKTGSGKTLAFLIPLLERLYMLKWGPMDGLGAVVISPTRELAVQTFNQLRDIGKYHSFSAGLVIGGKPLKEERDRLGRMNILIATPGRLLQHLDSTVGFESSGLKVLVLDEADRLLDLGFLPALKAIVSHFTTGSMDDPTLRRQTLLFSATQSSDLASLAKLSLKDPLYINCNKPGEEGVVPTNLEQFYAVVALDRKLDALWGFVKSHMKMKGVVFVTSGKQVRFIFETFRRLHPGLPLMHLHGKQKQPTRLSIFSKFSASKSALLISTDVAARGLDFPSVDWVIQLDCPDDVDSYIHRVGRTARYQSEGKALCLVCPSEEDGMVKRWEQKGLDVKKIKIKDSKMGSLKQQMQNFAFKDPEIKYLAQRAFISYMRSVHLQKDKTVFDLSELPAEAFAESLGLAGAPQIKLMDNGQGKAKRMGPAATVTRVSVDDGEVSDDEGLGIGAQREIVGSSESEGEDSEQGSGMDEEEQRSGDEGKSEEVSTAKAAVRTKYDRMFQRKNQSILAPHYSAMVAKDDDSGSDDDDVLKLARQDHDLSGDEDAHSGIETHHITEDAQKDTSDGPKFAAPTMLAAEDLSKRKLKAASSKRGLLKTRPTAEKVLFDDSGNVTTFYQAGLEAETRAGAQRSEFVKNERERMKDATKIDREAAREIKREKKRKRKEREREMRRLADDSGDEGGGAIAMLGSPMGEAEEDLGEMSTADEESHSRQSKAQKQKRNHVSSIEDEEALALSLLNG